MTTFKELGLSEDVLSALTKMGFEKPSEIQEKAIPQLLKGDKDFIGIAQTGTGKTAAFGLPLLERIDTSKPHTQALVLAPTRELGQQIAEQLKKYSENLEKVNVLAVYGGAAIYNQIKALQKTQHIIIATPGRLIDLIKRKAVNLKDLQFLVLDEADEMLNMGFKDELNQILSYTPSEKATWLFSATMPGEIKRIVSTYMHEPFEVRINPKDSVNTNIVHQYTFVRQPDKTEVLARFLDSDEDMRGIVFCRTRMDTQRLAEELQKKNYKADSLHGDLSQMQRDKVMRAFKSHNLQVLVATDVAARGIDVNDLTHVFHFSVPDDAMYYTHRSGRTARAGKTGISLVFVNGREHGKIDRFQKELGIRFEKVLIPNNEHIIGSRIESWCTQMLKKEANTEIDSDLLDQVQEMFGEISKEELVQKLLAIELEKLNLNNSGDLNHAPERGGRGEGRGGRGSRDSRGGRGGRDARGGRGRDRDSRSGGGRDRRSRDTRGSGESRGPSDRRKSRDSRGSTERKEYSDSRSSSRDNSVPRDTRKSRSNRESKENASSDFPKMRTRKSRDSKPETDTRRKRKER